MKMPLVATAALGLAIVSGASGSAEPSSLAIPDLEPAINGGVSPSGRFPTRAMEEEFTKYLAWVEAEGSSRLVAFESLVGDDSAGHGLASPRMQEQFRAYMEWVEKLGLSPFYAFTAGARP